MFFYSPLRSNSELMNIVERRRNYLRLSHFDKTVVSVMRQLDRRNFAPPDLVNPYEDEPFAIGHNQTCSQPSMVAAMATILDLQPGYRVLEIGTGSGYSAAVAAKLIEPNGELYTIEIFKELSAFAEQNIKRMELSTPITFIIGDGSVGWKPAAPYDRIYLTAGVGKKFKPDILLGQLTENGKLLYPEAFGSLFLIEKTRSGERKAEFKGVGFVYLRGANSGFD